MKRGKDDEKIMGPMFPRLHVNDTEKGGPRAPPRNKMALYEQLSIPSQSFNSGLLPLNPNKAASVVPSASSSQASSHGRGMSFPLRLCRSTHPTEKSYAGYSNFSTPLAQLEQKKNLDEEDFTVPIFVQSEIGQDHSKNCNDRDREKLCPFSPVYSGRSMKIQNVNDKEPKQTSTTGSNLRQEGRSQNEMNPKEFMAVGKSSVKSVETSSAREKNKGPLKQTDASADQEHRDRLVNNFHRVQNTGANLHHESRARIQPHNSMCGNDVSNEPVRGLENGRSSTIRRDFCPEELESPNNPTLESGYHGDKTRGSLQIGNGEGGDDASETSMVDSISGLDISPDDVVGIIGQKHFWKARRAIVNQQRVFAVQVFELHRLIKVQRLIAESPHILVEDGAYLGKPLKGSSAKKLPLEYFVKPSPHIVEHKDDLENPNHNMECSAENAVGKTSLSSVQNVSMPSNYRPFSGNPLSTSVSPDSKMSPWCFHRPPEHQWLVPVMSPSEGLIYKPYPGHGFMGPACGPPVLNPMMDNFINPAYAVPASHHYYQGVGFPLASPPFGHAYFPPLAPVNYSGISGSAVEQANHFAGQGSHSQSGQLSDGGTNFNMQHQSSCNVPTPKNRVIPNVVKLHESKESDLQGSIASSPAQRAQGIGVGHATEGRNALPLFPTSPAVNILEGAPQLLDTDQPTRAIKVVPHNARSATESAARIFQSIQDERKQC